MEPFLFREGSSRTPPLEFFYQKRLSGVEYRRIIAALFLFEGDLDEWFKDAMKLSDTLTNDVGADTHFYKIPASSDMDTGECIELLDKCISEFAETHGQSGNLLLIYYGGHGIDLNSEDHERRTCARQGSRFAMVR